MQIKSYQHYKPSIFACDWVLALHIQLQKKVLNFLPGGGAIAINPDLELSLDTEDKGVEKNRMNRPWEGNSRE